MISTVEQPSDADALSERWGPQAGGIRCGHAAHAAPNVLSVADLMALDVLAPEMLIEGMVPMRGASLIVGAPKSGKTLLAAQSAIAVASGTALLQNYRVFQQGAVMMIEQDDPAATASVKQILQRSPVPVAGIPFYLVPKVPFAFGPDLTGWLEGEITSRSLRLVVFDSYTALRGSRTKGSDIVKSEQDDLRQLDALAKRTNSALVILHHNSKGQRGARLDPTGGRDIRHVGRDGKPDFCIAVPRPRRRGSGNVSFVFAGATSRTLRWCSGSEGKRWTTSMCWRVVRLQFIR